MDKKKKVVICDKCWREFEIEDNEDWGYCPFCENDQVEATNCNLDEDWGGVVMEEKERYGCRYIRGEFDVFIDNDTDKYLTIQEVKHLLNQQDKENEQLKQQLHDLPNKIVREIEEEIIKYDLLKNFPNEAGYCMLDSILDTILKKYGDME